MELEQLKLSPSAKSAIQKKKKKKRKKLCQI